MTNWSIFIRELTLFPSNPNHNPSTSPHRTRTSSGPQHCYSIWSEPSKCQPCLQRTNWEYQRPRGQRSPLPLSSLCQPCGTGQRDAEVTSVHNPFPPTHPSINHSINFGLMTFRAFLGGVCILLPFLPGLSSGSVNACVSRMMAHPRRQTLVSCWHQYCQLLMS